jgi:hypothetical protein
VSALLGVTIKKRFHFHETIGNGTMAFGIIQLGLASAHTSNVEYYNRIVNFLASKSWSVGMASYHNKRSLFNMDISGGFPYLVSQGLVYSEPGYLKLFPALPERWNKGSVEGLKLRGNVTLKKLMWNGKSVQIVLNSAINGLEKIELPFAIESLKNGIKSSKGKNTFTTRMRAGVDDIIEINVPKI